MPPFRATTEGPTPWLQIAGDPRFCFTTVHLTIPHLPEALSGYRILFLSDIHLRKRYEPVLTAFLPTAQAAHPDLILIGGDLVEDKVDHSPAIPATRQLLDNLRALTASPMTFAVVGNHDGPRLPASLSGAPVEFLINRRALVGPPNSPIELIGLGTFDGDTTPEILSLHAPTPGIPRIILSHYPYLIRQAQHLSPHLYLTGHTHGGQICLPRLLPLLSHDPLPKKYAAGIHTWPNSQITMITSRGLGFSNLQIRTFCPPEAHLIILE